MRLARIVVFCPSISKTSTFFSKGLGCTLVHSGSTFSELKHGDHAPSIVLMETQKKNFTAGSTVLDFDVSDSEFDDVLTNALMNGGTLHEGIEFPVDGKRVAVLELPESRQKITLTALSD